MYHGNDGDQSYSSLTTKTVGFYYDGIRSSVLRCVRDILTKRAEQQKTFSIGDFGTADGKMSFPLMDSIIEKHLGPAPFPSNVFTCAVGKSMYTRRLPKNTLDITISTAATHWLSDPKQCEVKDGLIYVHADAEELQKIRLLAANDWSNFVLARGREHKPGPSYYADAFVKFVTPLMHNTIFCGLSETRSTEDKKKILDLYFQIVWEMAYKGEIGTTDLSYYEVVATKKHVL